MRTSLKATLVAAVTRFRRSEDGSLTTLSLFIFVMMAMVCGVAIDASMFQSRTVLMQNAANSAAHAALITRRTSPASTAVDRAVSIAQAQMPQSIYGAVLAPGDVEFGIWDTANRTFSPDSREVNAVRVTVRQTLATGNPYYTTALRLVGIGSWGAVRTAVFRNVVPTCMRQSIISQGAMRIYSNSSFYSPICLHSNTSFQLDTGNTFEAGVRVSVPDSSKVITPDANSNTGLSAALNYRTMDVASLTAPIPNIISGLTTAGSPYIPSYITNQTVLDITTIEKDQFIVKPNQLTSGRIYRATCNSNGTTNPQVVVVSPLTVLSQVAIVTNCRVRFENSVKLEDAVVATSSTAFEAITGGSGVVLGKNDNCASGGGAQLVTSGRIHMSSTLSIYGSQLLAAGNIRIDAQVNGTVGVSIVAGGTFTNSSEATWRACPETSRENTYHGVRAAVLVQ